MTEFDFLPEPISREDLVVLRDMIERESGIVLGDEKLPQLARIILERSRACRMPGPRGYILGVVEGSMDRAELKSLIARLVIGETSFFRSPGQFQALKERIFPEMAAAGAAFPLRIWSAGCATGEEAYSIAIAALEAFQGRFLMPVTVLATDVNEGFLNVARKGTYPASAVKDVSPDLLDKYFYRMPKGTVKVSEDVCRLVTFEEGNLAEFLEISSPPRYSVIFCRNVMIYFRPETTRRMVAKFRESLEENGALFLGHSETLWGVSDAFHLQEVDGTYFYRKRRPPQSVPGAAAAKTRALAPDSRPPSPGSPEEVTGKVRALIGRAEGLADRELLAEAELACREALAAAPELPEAAYLMAVVLRRRGRIAEALFYAERALSVEPSFVLAEVEAAECLGLMGRDAEAADRWKAVIRLLEGSVRMPRLMHVAGLSARSLKEYAAARLRP